MAIDQGASGVGTCAIIRPADKPILAVDRHGMCPRVTSPALSPDPLPRPRLLAVAERLPRPDESAGSSRFLAILSHLTRLADVDLWVERDETTGRTPLPPARVQADRDRLATCGVRVLPTTWRALREALAAHAYETVLFEVYDMASRYLPVVRDQCPRAAMIVDSVDVHFARFEAGAAVGAVSWRLARRVRRAEIAVYRSADAVVVVSSADAGLLSGEPGMPPIISVPNCVTTRSRAVVPRRPEALFVGHFRHAPNLDGLRWFVRHAWPSVRARRPDALLTVIGSYPSAEVLELGQTPGVTVLGYVPTLDDALDRAAVAIAPLRYGAGMKGKVTDALAAGLPIVTTTVGAQGLDIISGRHAVVADEPDEFAAAVVELFDDPDHAAAIGLSGQQLVATACGPRAIEAALVTLLESARAARASSPRAGRPGRRLRLLWRACRHWGWTRARRQARWIPFRSPDV